ncbi:asparagine synthase (glutamine-hydrolyzing) [Nitrosophilus kaiyonis]|uniref:asparagine synthase (glutamine-hydrolyzing) n=1 Tax=Nitrosophilus kaiyonis TaxID=2930200 RepID=UPI002491EE20|nr:asparagine synthase (glutamine-hydrolyzing) [Nitrosophilus kaiyonis]
MCGFLGVVGRYDEKRAKESLNLLIHRGKDFQGFYKDKNIFLGHNRLYILNKDVNQPLIKDNKVLVFNGEIYNYKDFDVLSDTEAIIKAYPNFEKLEGMFSFGIYDKKNLYLAKDIFGKKPLYFYKNSEIFIFALEIKAILHYIKKAEFNKNALSCYLSFGSIPNRSTFYKDIYKINSGEILKFDIENFSYEIDRFDTLLKKENGDIEKILIDSIRKRLQGDFEVASLLSGGVDSSLVSALAKQEQKKLTTYSIGYKEEKYSELKYAKIVANHIKSEHKEFIFTKDDFFESFDFLIDHFDEPIGDSASLPLYFLFKQIKKDGFRVVLSGEGGDEIFLGYRQYFEFLDLYRAKNLKYKNWLKNYFKSNFSPNKEWEWYKRVFNDEVIFRSSCEVFTDLQKNLFLKQNVKDNESLLCIKGHLDEWRNSNFEKEVDFFTFLDLKVRLESLYLKKLDMVSMANTIEARTPLLDKRLLYAAFSKKRDKEPKYILKKIAAKYIPKEIIERKKRGFSYPHMEWLKNSQYILKIEKINKEVRFFKEEQLKFLIKNAKRNRFSRHFWLVLAFLLWFERRFL